MAELAEVGDCLDTLAVHGADFLKPFETPGLLDVHIVEVGNPFLSGDEILIPAEGRHPVPANIKLATDVAATASMG